MSDKHHISEEEEEQLIAQLKDDSQGPGKIHVKNGNTASILLDIIAGICKYK